MSPAATATEEVVDNKPTALSREYAEWEGTLRGRYFHLREVPISKFDKIEKQSVDRVPTDDGTGTVERFDANRRSRLLLSASIVEAKPALPDDGIDGLGTRLVVALNTIVNELHFGDPEQGALKQELANEKAAGEKKGNG